MQKMHLYSMAADAYAEGWIVALIWQEERDPKYFTTKNPEQYANLKIKLRSLIKNDMILDQKLRSLIKNDDICDSARCSGHIEEGPPLLDYARLLLSYIVFSFLNFCSLPYSLGIEGKPSS